MYGFYDGPQGSQSSFNFHIEISREPRTNNPGTVNRLGFTGPNKGKVVKSLQKRRETFSKNTESKLHAEAAERFEKWGGSQLKKRLCDVTYAHKKARLLIQNMSIELCPLKFTNIN
jgi:hypothetical protein